MRASFLSHWLASSYFDVTHCHRFRCCCRCYYGCFHVGGRFQYEHETSMRHTRANTSRLSNHAYEKTTTNSLIIFVKHGLYHGFCAAYTIKSLLFSPSNFIYFIIIFARADMCASVSHNEGQTFVNWQNEEKRELKTFRFKIEITPKNEVLLLKKMGIYSLIFLLLGY